MSQDLFVPADRSFGARTAANLLHANERLRRLTSVKYKVKKSTEENYAA